MLQLKNKKKIKISKLEHKIGIIIIKILKIIFSI